MKKRLNLNCKVSPQAENLSAVLTKNKLIYSYAQNLKYRLLCWRRKTSPLMKEEPKCKVIKLFRV